MLLLDREGSFHTESVPDGKLPAGNHRQFRCYCPLVALTGYGEAGIDSVAEFRGLMQPGHPRFETPRSALVAQVFLPVFFRGWAMAISISDKCATAEVSLILPNAPH